MKTNEMNWKEEDRWGLKEFIFLMLLEFVFVIGCIKFVVHPIYSHWLDNVLYAGTLMGLTIAIILILGVYFIALRPKKLSWSEVGIKRFAVKDWKIIVIFSVILMVGAVIIVVLTSFIGNSWENSKTEAIQQNVTFVTVLIAFISAAVISPIYEEIFYRGFLYRWLRTRIGFIGAILLSSTIFTIVHIPTYNVMPVNFFSGIIFALAYERTNSIWPSVIIHGLTNGIMVLLTSLG
ncbi:type II CAAX endopeptidase family protein [Viridibacillus sp. FSL R5-0477]|uniref:Abortive infection protein n=1 Tax=Viridibacillus arenosi FSL R5-213 TaxID=1227360 RepID=W4F1Z7_9BACL|nr:MULTISPECIES: type II CAAX endopeptidase family protein [Viridibacillus]ETT86459.1 abortive infection protein [Viridibacillus arenosi FSL R5-213]OMC84660.1 CAAX protease family protein [Viridibacillus sp. FSL H8-0123]OMC91708.1 CAAX protease family protein [Viridibacillus arenosi]